MNQVIINIKIFWMKLTKCENYLLEEIGLPRIIHFKKERGGKKNSRMAKGTH